MDEAPKKGNPSLSIDRAAFLLLRVKKAFKRKRQQRKDKQAAQQAAASVAAQTKAYRNGPPPLLRSRTLPAIVVPGISVVNAQIDPNRLSAVDTPSVFGARWSLQPKSSRASLTSDDANLEYRRKSSGSTHSGPPILGINSGLGPNDPYIYAFDEYERHADGTVVLRIPAPHVVAARAYRMSVSSGSSFTNPCSTTSNNSGAYMQAPLAIGANTANVLNSSGTGAGAGTSNSSNTALYRLARLLSQTTKSGRHSPTSKDDAPRRLSWERRDHINSKLPRSASIDSMVEAVWNDSPRPSIIVPTDSTTNQFSSTSYYFNNNNNSKCPTNNNYLQTTPSSNQSNYNNNFTFQRQPSQLNINYGNYSGYSCSGSIGSASGTTFINRRESLLSPSSGRRTKQNRGIVEIALPDLLSNNESLENTKEELLMPNKSSIKKSLNSIKLNNEIKLKNQNNFNSIVKSIKSPLFKKPFKDMEFLVPQPPGQKDQRKLRRKQQQTQEKQQQQGKHENVTNNGKLFFNTNGLHNILLNHNHQNKNKILNKIEKNLIKTKNSDADDDDEDINDFAILRDKNKKLNENNENNKQNNQKLINNINISNQSYQTNFNNNKMTKKQLKLAQAQLDKLTQINIHLTALFSAVEHGHLEKAKTILESTDVDVNSLNSDGLSPLDVAVLSNNRSMTKMLLQHGAIEGSQFKLHESLGTHLNTLLYDAENRIHDLSGSEDIPQAPFSTRASFSSIIGNSGPSVTGCTGTEADKQIGLWERRIKGLRRMLLGWDQARPPDFPSAVTVDVSSLNAVTVCILEPMDGPISTKFKVQWSTRADFCNIVGEREIKEWSSYQGVMGATCRIYELTQGRRYFFRSSCGNVKGYGPYKSSVPFSVIPSSWRDIDNREHRFAGRQRILDDLFAAVKLARPGDASELTLENINAPLQRPKKKTTIKQLFSATSKFQKNLRRGIYLACILYYEDKVLVTNEDFLPVIEIDETYPGSLHTDYHWLMKVACTWDDVKSLRTDMERNSTSAVHFRTKLLSSACQMQSALCIADLGQLYHKPLRDSHGTVVLSCVNTVKSPKSISVLNSRWVPLNKIQKKVTALHEDNNINEILISSIADQLKYHQTSTVRLSRGLYLGYLKMQSSVDQIQIVVPAKTPNVLPHFKIRENPHISAEEWAALRRGGDMSQTNSLEFNMKSDGKSEIQKLFLEVLTNTMNRLFIHMNISPEDAVNHRLYDIEVIELSPDVSFLIVCPPVESACAAPGQREILLQRGDLLSLPIQAFEMVHLRTYQNSIIQKYSRLSCILELDTALANHSHREAFSTSELQIAKERLMKLQELTASLNAVWKGVRWLMDVISFARDRTCVPTVSMKLILEYNRMESFEEDVDTCNVHLLQLPQRDNKLMKSSPGRGSWPGPAANISNSSCYLAAEYSKSEQNLGCSSLSPGYLSINSNIADSSSRKNSADSQQSYYSAGEGNTEPVAIRLPPSRSEDTLLLTKKQHFSQHRKRSTAISSKPVLNVKATESIASLSSDSDGTNYIKLKNKPKEKASYLKPTLTALQNEMQFLSAKEPLHISEPSSPCTEKPILSEIARQHSSDDEDKMKSNKTVSNLNTSLVASTSGISSSQKPGIIQVYAAYETGLANGTSLKLHVTPRTSAREVVDLVVKQLNMAVTLKGKEGPIYAPDKLENFCLVAVIGARERCLRDDFKPLQLQNPWKKGRLYVRQKHDLLAAIEHSNREAHLI